MTYDSSIFDVSTLRAAKEIILTPEDFSTEERWKRETPYLADLIINNLEICSSDVVLDYGCGVGRVAKELIERTYCRVVGVDKSSSMRALAASYVDSRRFFSCSFDALYLLPRFHKVISIWTLQHIPELFETLSFLHERMARDARIFVVNNTKRVIPTTSGWEDDGINVSSAFREQHFIPENTETRLRPDIVGKGLAQNTYWRLFKKLGE